MRYYREPFIHSLFFCKSGNILPNAQVYIQDADGI